MVNVADKDVTTRSAIASAVVTMKPDVLADLLAGRLSKGEALLTAKIAGIQAAKFTANLIPLCHPIALEWADVQITRKNDNQIIIHATTRSVSRTGVEMEALTAATVAALTLYDMAKAADKSIVIGPICLESKSGGRSGDYQRPRPPAERSS